MTKTELWRKAAALGSPKDAGKLELIILRLANGEHRTPEKALVSEKGGLEGDRWSSKSPANPMAQVSLINSRLLELIAGGRDRMSLAGDNLVVDLDLSRSSLPPGSRLRVGNAVLELTDYPHKGCVKFERLFGKEARALVDSPEGQSLRLRGVYARVVSGGAVRVGDAVGKAPP